MRFRRFSSMVWLLSFGFAMCLCAANSQEKKPLSFEQIFKGAEPRVTIALPTVTGWADEEHYLITKKRDGKTFAVDVTSGKEELYRDLGQYKEVLGEGVNAAVPASATTNYDKLIYSKDKDLYLLTTATKSLERLTQNPAEEKNPTFSPDGRLVAFTRDNDLYVIDLQNRKESRLTTDGSDVIYNGWASWVYYEEIFGRPSHYRAFWWSPDSRKLAFYRFNDSRVPVFPIYNAEGTHGFLENTRYPAAGDPNPEVRVGIITIAGGKTVWADFNEKDDQYFGMPFWTPDSKHLFVQWMNRGQDHYTLYAVDPAAGKKTEVYHEEQSSWVEWQDRIDFLDGNGGFIIRSDKDGWAHLYAYAMNGQLLHQITQGDWTVVALQALDTKRGTVCFTAKKENSTRTDLYRATLDGKNIERLTFGEYTHTVKVSPNGSHFVTTYSNVATPPKMALCDAQGKVVRELGDSKSKDMDAYDVARGELFRVRTPDGFDLPVVWTLPTHFDPQKRYPVLISIYGGPDAGTVSDKWLGISDQWLAQEGVIQVSMDHRGSGHFGKKATALMHRQLGKWEMNDYIEVVKWLRTKPFVDSTRVCITGGSYGGYVTCMALTYGADYFTHGIAEFSVTDWKLYDSHYVERYMDTPAENPEGYKNGSVMTYANKYKGLMRIVHGAMDDNVHMQNTIQLIDTLENLGKHFELMVYPGERHGWGGPKATHLRNDNYRFYYRNLLHKEFPEELFQ